MSKTVRSCALSQRGPSGPVQVRLLEPSELKRCQKLLDKRHYLKSPQPVGERLHYVATDAQGRWLALLVFNAAAKHLKHRDRWIKWTPQQRRRRLALVVNNSRFLLLPDSPAPDLGSQVLRLVLDRLSADWQQRYGHPILIVETFVDPDQFDGTVYSANGWTELGQTDGWGRHGRDYYVKHDKPKRLFVRELCPQACRSLQAEHLKPDLAGVESKVPARCSHTVQEIRSMTEHFKQVPEFRDRVESYPVWSLLTMMLLAVLCGAPRGQKDLAKFARGLSQPQRRALGIRRDRRTGRYPSPSQSTYCRLMQGLDERKVEEMVLDIQEQVRGKPPADELIALDGKEPKHGGGQGVLSAISVPSLYYLGSAIVETKTNEIPVAPKLFQRLDLEGRFVSLDALNTQDETARALVLEAGADYLLTVKKNRKTVHKAIEKIIPAPEADFPPQAPTPTRARTEEWNKNRFEERTIRTETVGAEQVCFPLAAQAARLLRQVTGRRPERVCLITSAEPKRLDAQKWLHFNRVYWGIENGLHQRLDVSYHDDLCRIRSSKGILLMGMFRRLSNSLFMHWRGLQPHPEHKTTTDFHSAMGEEHCRRALRIVSSKQANFHPPKR